MSSLRARTLMASTDTSSVRVEYSLVASKLYENHELDYLASQKGSPAQAVVDYVDCLSRDVSARIIKRTFPEGYLFEKYFFWVDFPVRGSYVFKYGDEFYFHFSQSNPRLGFTLRSKDYGSLLLKALNALVACHLGASSVDLNRLQIVPSRNCNDCCRYCPFVLDNSSTHALSKEHADIVIEFLNNNSQIETLLFVGNGEPFLNCPAILRILRGVKHVKNVGVYTNGFWGESAERYLPGIAASIPQADIVINLAIDVQHSVSNTRNAMALLHHFLATGQEQPSNIRIHLRGLLFDGVILPHDPMLGLLSELEVGEAELQALIPRLESGKQVELAPWQGKVLVSYNRLRSASDPEAIPENIKEWVPSLVVTDEGVLGLGNYEVIVPVVGLEDLATNQTAYQLARGNILLNYLQSPLLVDIVESMSSAFPEILEHTYLATDIIKNVYKNPSIGLTFMLQLSWAEYQRDPVSNRFLGQVLEDLGIHAGLTPKELKGLVETWLLPSMPAAVSRKRNWWFGAKSAKMKQGSALNRWLPLWQQAEQDRAEHLASSFSATALMESIYRFLHEKYGLRRQQVCVTSISLTGSSVYSFSKTEPVKDIDYIATIDYTGITDILMVPGDKASVWVISEEYLKGSTTRALHIDLAINIEHGLVLYGSNPVPLPAPIVERAKMAFFYANLIQRIIFDRNYRDSFKRMVELKRILSQIAHCLEGAPRTLDKAVIMSEDDRRNFVQIRDAFRQRLGECEFNQMAAWRGFDEIMASDDRDRQGSGIQALFVEATCLKAKLLDFISTIAPLYPENGLYQKSRQHVYAIFGAAKSDHSAGRHEEFLHSFSDDFSVVLTLAANSPHLSIRDRIEAVLADPKSPFAPEQVASIRRALQSNPHLRGVDYSHVRSGVTLDLSKGGHEDEVRTVDFSPLGNHIIVTAGYDHKVKCIDILEGKTVGVFEGHRGIVQCARFSQDGKLIATAGRDGTVRVLRAQNCREIFRFDKSNGGHSDWVMWADFSYDSQYLISAGWDKLVIVRDLRSGRAIHVFDEDNGGPLDHARIAAFSPNHKLVLVAGDDGVVRCYEWPVCQLWWVLSAENGGHSRAVFFAAFDRRGDHCVSTADDGRVVVSDVIARRTVHVFAPTELGGAVGHIRAADFSPCGDFLAVVDSGGVARILDLSRKKTILTFGPEPVEPGRRNGFTSVRFSPDGSRLAIARADGAIKLLQFSGNAPERR